MVYTKGLEITPTLDEFGVKRKRNDEWIPAFAGMTKWKAGMTKWKAGMAKWKAGMTKR
jgi:hypothetical protein